MFALMDVVGMSPPTVLSSLLLYLGENCLLPMKVDDYDNDDVLSF
jgi:hypothetical protein